LSVDLPAFTREAHTSYLLPALRHALGGRRAIEELRVSRNVRARQSARSSAPCAASGRCSAPSPRGANMRRPEDDQGAAGGPRDFHARALVTGASGFIGGAVTRVLLGRGHAVRVLLRPGTAPNVPDASGLEIVRGDLRDARAVRTAAEDCAAIFHAGGCTRFRPAPPSSTP